jgi:hypothetical protein
MGTENSSSQAQHRVLGTIRIDKAADQFTLQVENVHEIQLKAWESHLQACAGFHKEWLLWPHRYDYRAQGICGGSGTLDITFDNYRMVLGEEVAQRCEARLPYRESEIWYMALGLASALSQF